MPALVVLGVVGLEHERGRRHQGEGPERRARATPPQAVVEEDQRTVAEEFQSQAQPDGDHHVAGHKEELVGRDVLPLHLEVDDADDAQRRDEEAAEGEEERVPVPAPAGIRAVHGEPEEHGRELDGEVAHEHAQLPEEEGEGPGLMAAD